MTDGHERDFGIRMVELADLSTRIGRRLPDDCCPGGNCVAVDERAAADFNARSAALYEEFIAAGYDASDWTGLWERSGAEARSAGAGQG